MVADFGLHFCSVDAGDDQRCFLQRHVAGHALVINLVTEFGELTATLNLVTRQTFRRERCDVPLRRVNIVTRDTRHRLGGLEATALLHEYHLAAVNIHTRVSGAFGKYQMLRQHIARHERQRGGDRFDTAAVTQGAGINLSFAGKFCRVDDACICRRFLRRRRAKLGDVFAARPMTFLAGHTENDAGLVVTIRRRGE